MKARTLNPLKLMKKQSKRNGKPRFIDDEDTVASSASFSIDDSNHTKSSSIRTHSLFSVSFDETQNSVHECASAQLSPQEIAEELWYTPSECEGMKQANAFTVKTLRRTANLSGSSSAYFCALNQMYQACASNGQEVISQAQQEALQTQLQLQPTRVGLESKMIKTDKSAQRHALLHLIYNLAQEHSELSSEQLAIQMARECQKITQPSQTFAAQVALARC
uniref:Uncharacterized protein n=1 Tax=Entomoneis paludosa TaxID=265537 RepID=A0A7S2YGJ5_9STRA|eukprot:CAMPEP_0172442310 /NCGR_PEP_ID=MMETSP1065-20121228/2771_1 /TAXON_ID=265537 /ORGANISM="Amphiprora paludosa, Strain CCMP125" /LENGTH=220 /DNA_ID=CAMNT_0013192127 /DNA_START=71 /DNA_END=733 /DNA_ORIENTATION=+